MFLALLERQRIASEREFFPFACLMALTRNVAFGMKHDRVYSPQDFMPKAQVKKKVTELRRGPLPADIYFQFAKAKKEQDEWLTNSRSA